MEGEEVFLQVVCVVARVVPFADTTEPIRQGPDQYIFQDIYFANKE